MKLKVGYFTLYFNEIKLIRYRNKCIFETYLVNSYIQTNVYAGNEANLRSVFVTFVLYLCIIQCFSLWASVQ